MAGKLLIFTSIVLIVLLLAGCIGGDNNNKSGFFGGGETPITYNFTILSETEVLYKPTLKNDTHKKPGLEINKSAINLSNYTATENDTLRIMFIDMSNNDEDGRIILISKGDFDIGVINIPEGKGEDAVFYLTKYADDLEYLIVPSSINGEDDGAVIESVPTATAVFPDYNDADINSLKSKAQGMNISVKKFAKGDIITGAGLTLRFATPYKDAFIDARNNALSFYLNDRNFSMFIANDIIEGVVGRIVSTGDYQKVQVMTVPSYGRAATQGGTGTSPMTVLMDHLSPEAAIFEGRGINFDRTEVVEDPRDFFSRYFKIRDIKRYSVGNEKQLVLRYDGNMYNITKG